MVAVAGAPGLAMRRPWVLKKTGQRPLLARAPTRWEMVNAGHEHIGWNDAGTTIVINNPERLASHVLPKYFRRSQYSSWVSGALLGAGADASRRAWRLPLAHDPRHAPAVFQLC